MATTVVLKKGAKGQTTWHDTLAERARRRARALSELHGVRWTYDEQTDTYTLDASEFYEA